MAERIQVRDDGDLLRRRCHVYNVNDTRDYCLFLDLAAVNRMRSRFGGNHCD